MEREANLAPISCNPRCCPVFAEAVNQTISTVINEVYADYFYHEVCREELPEIKTFRDLPYSREIEVIPAICTESPVMVPRGCLATGFLEIDLSIKPESTANGELTITSRPITCPIRHVEV